MLGARDTRLGGTRMKHELEQVQIESYGLTGPEVVVAAAIKVYLMNLPWSDAKKKMDAVISQLKSVNGSVTVQTVATGLLDFLYDCWISTKR